MAIDFPASPTNGQTFTSGALVYTYDGTKWKAQPAGVTGGTKIEVGNTKAEIVDTGSDGRFAVTTEGTERLRVNSSGQVGIGTTSANELVELRKDQDTNTRLRITNASDTASATAGIHLAPYGGNWYIEALRSSTFANPLRFTFDGSEKARLTYDGKLLVGTSSGRTVGNTAGSIQIEGVTDTALTITDNSNGSAGDSTWLTLARTRGTAVGGTTAVSSGDWLGNLDFAGHNGSTFNVAARISGQVDGTVSGGGAGDMPGRLVFSTTADGASSPTERMRITSKGYFKASNDGTYGASFTTEDSHYLHSTANNATIRVNATNGSLSSPMQYLNASRSASSLYSFLACYSGNYSDLEIVLRGDGNALADGTFAGGGADYAEYFEWIDGNPEAEDRRGISVVLEGDTIRPALEGEDPLGVISGNPSVVGDAAWNRWFGKYLRDDYGTYIRDENGERHLNPAYDPDAEYIPREDRPEWDCVGLMGKLRIRKGQPTGSRWIKMRDISDSIEEWLVR